MHGLILLLLVTVTFTWQPATSGGTPTSYELCYGSSPSQNVQCVNVGNVTTKQLQLDIDQMNYVVVKAVNNWGKSSASNEVAVGKPQAPTNLSAQ